MHFEPIYLASRSPRRQELLRAIGVPFDVLLPTDAAAAEALEALLPGEPPRRYVERVTLAKAAAARAALAASALAPRPILVADTTVALGSRVLGKPRDAAEASDMLGALSGRTHRVMTAVAVVRGERVDHRVNVSRVRFARISAARIDAYVASGEPMDKAGAYGIQGFAATFVRNIEGSHSGIMGLPLFETAQLLRAAR